jgi:hypothetical protein
MSYITGDFVSAIKTKYLILFSEIIDIYCGSYEKHIKILCGKMQSYSMFNIHGSVHRNNILVYKSQQDAHVTLFIFV